MQSKQIEIYTWTFGKGQIPNIEKALFSRSSSPCIRTNTIPTQPLPKQHQAQKHNRRSYPCARSIRFTYGDPQRHTWFFIQTTPGFRYMNDIMHDIADLTHGQPLWLSNPAQMAIRQVARSFACSHYRITPFLGQFRTHPNTDTVIHPQLINIDPYSNKQDTTDYPLVQVLVIPLRTTKPPPHAHDANSPSPPTHKGAYKTYWSHATDEAGLWHILREGFVRPTNWEPTNWDDDNLPCNKAYLPHRGFNGFHQDNAPDNLQLGFCHTNLRKALRLPKARAGPAEGEIATGFTIFGRVTSSTSQHSHMRQKGGGWTTQKALIEAHLNDTSRDSRNFTTVFSHTEKSVIDAQYAEITGITVNIFHPRPSPTTPPPVPNRSRDNDRRRRR
ncbi:unnamed protein product [Symbiodinium natans]|uniref:Uncharacterized protein n=1 Tax=Symbiodinium natans TaxID=878477 RepID=A0A812LGC6_9DINO|nr:unnamed protein product [Symbiodinium natans]